MLAREPHPSVTKIARTLLARADALQAVQQRIAEGDPSVRKSLDRLIREADEKLTIPPQSVARKKRLPPSGDAHDYLSLAPYWWPNPSTADSLPYVQRDGEVNPERFQYDVTPLENMTRAVRPLTFAYFFTSDEKYARHATQLLRAWFIDPLTRMNPNAQFAQFVPGFPEMVDGHGMIETVRFRWLPDGVGLLEGSPSWTEQDTSAMKNWLSDYQQWLLQSAVGQAAARLRDNKGSWYAAQIALYSLFIGGTAEAKRWIEHATERIGWQIEPNGSQPLELRRTRSFHYSMYNLQALFDLACLGTHVGIDLFRFATPDGRSIRRALDFLIPFATGKAQWPYPQIDEPRWYILAEILRRAAVHFHEPKYEESMKLLPPSSLTAVDTTSFGAWLDLVEPAIQG